MWKRCESTKVLGWIWKIVRTSGKILATPLLRDIEVDLHFPVVIFVCSREDSLIFESSSVFPRDMGTSLYHRAMSGTLSLFLGADVSDN